MSDNLRNLKKTLAIQATLEMARTALALTSYHKEQATFPDSLSEPLFLQYIQSPPIDPINGNPLKYKRDSDGKSFTLYSIGWNGVDDGGRVISENGNTYYANLDKGDWVWPQIKQNQE